MPVTEPKELAVIGPPDTTIAVLHSAALIAPIYTVLQAEKEVAELKVETEEQSREATALAGRFSGWSSKIEAYFKGLGKPHYDRYKIFNRLASEGVKSLDVEIPGADRLNKSKIAAEAKVRAFIQASKKQTAQRQEAINRAIASDVRSIDQQIADLFDSGKPAEARKLAAEREIISQTPVVIAAPVDIGGAAVGETVKWSIAPDTGLMDLVKAVAAGTVPLYREVTVKGVKEMRPIFIVNEVVMNQATRAMGKNLNWPGVVLEDDISLRTRKI